MNDKPPSVTSIVIGADGSDRWLSCQLAGGRWVTGDECRELQERCDRLGGQQVVYPKALVMREVDPVTAAADERDGQAITFAQNIGPQPLAAPMSSEDATKFMRELRGREQQG